MHANREQQSREPALVKVVAISAACGTGGDWIAQAVAERLDVPVATALTIPLGAAKHAVPSGPVADLGRRVPAPVYDFLHSIGRVSDLVGAPAVEQADSADRAANRAAAAAAAGDLAVSRGAVSLTGAAAVLTDREERVLRVRSDGPIHRSVTQVMLTGGGTRHACERRLAQQDRKYNACTRHDFGVDPTDARLYHLDDPTVVPLAACADGIVGAAGGGM